MELDKRDAAYSKVYAKVLNFLSFSKRSKKELLDKIDKYISKSGLDSKDKKSVKEQIILALEKDGYLKDDTDVDFARSYIEGLRNSGKSLNYLKISHFLVKKGISKEIIDDFLGNLDKNLIYESALRDAKKKLSSLDKEDKYTKKKKLLNYLYRKGYPFDISSSVVDTLL